MRRFVACLVTLLACGKSKVRDAPRPPEPDYINPPRVAASSFHWVVTEGGGAGFIPATGGSSSTSFHVISDSRGAESVLRTIPGGVAINADPNDVCTLTPTLRTARARVALDVNLPSLTPEAATCIRSLAPPAISFYQKEASLSPAELDVLTHLDNVEALGVNVTGDAVAKLLGERANSPDSAALRYVNLVHGRLTADGLAALAKRRNLRALGFRGLDSEAPTGLTVFATLPELERFDASYTHITDNELSAFALTKPLRWLNLESTTIGDGGLRTLAGLDALEYLSVSGTNVGDDGIEAIVSLPKLRWLSLYGTKVTPHVFDLLARSRSLETIDISALIGLEAFRAAHPKLKINSS